MPDGSKSHSTVRPLDRDKMPVLSKEEIASVMKVLDDCSDAALARYALIGGALFTFLDIDYDTRDVDVAADRYLDGYGIWPNKKAMPRSTSKLAGHYLVDGVCVDWMTEGAVGSEPLYRAALDGAYLKDGIWCATIEHAMAIRIYAGREKDLKAFWRFQKDGLVNGELVVEMVKELTGRDLSKWLAT